MLESIIFCIVLVILGIVGLVYDFASGLLTAGIDGLLLVLVCLLAIVVFGIQAALTAKKYGIIGPHRGGK